MKTCIRCKEAKSLDHFFFIKKNKNGTDLYRARCNECFNNHYREKYRSKSSVERSKIYRSRVAGRSFEELKDERLRYRFGISIEDFNRMLEEQGHKCYICEKPISGKEVKVDHCHKTKRVRKLLCHGCNTSLGHMRDDPRVFERCVNYLKEQF